MSSYTYSEIQNMQQKAMERVKEMKRNSDIITQSARKEFDFTPVKSNYKDSSTTVAAKVTNMPPNFPQNNPYPSFKEFFRETEESQKEREKESIRPVEKTRKNSIENLFNEPDKALLLGLIMLLKSEGADETLIMALSYILS